MLTILKKELWTYFGNWTVYAVISSFIIVCSLFLWFFDNDFNIFNSEETSLSSFFFLAPWVLLFIIPALTMRQFAEERQMGTLNWLYTQPIKIYNLILGKFLSVCIVILVMILLTTVFVWILRHFSIYHLYDFGSILSGYIGLFLLACFFGAIGLMTSSFFSNQVIAYILAILLNFCLFYGLQGIASYNILGSWDYIAKQVGADFHYTGFLKGLIDTRDLLYFLGTTVVFLLLSYVSLSKPNQL